MERLNGVQKNLETLVESSTYVKRAHDFAKHAHGDQERADKSPYFESHCEKVAKIIYEEWGIENEEIIAASYLHDTVEDVKKVTIPIILSNFGVNVASWVEGVTQLESKDGTISKEQLARQTIDKVNQASYIEPQVAIIKLADRLHNMRTLMHMKVEKQVSKAKETLFYAKLAESLGMWEVMRELEDLSLMYSDQKEYQKYLEIRDSDPRTQPLFVEGLKSSLKMIIEDTGIEAKVEARKNSLLKIKDKKGRYLTEKIDDLMRFGIVVKQGKNETETRNRVMIVLGALWQEFDTMEDKSRFDNFFFTNRDNGYSAIHLTVKFREGDVKIALTCEAKEIYNNQGILSLIRNGETDLHKYALKRVITPTNDNKFFKARARGIDYAFSISPQMGAGAEYMLINGNRHELTEIIPNGAQVEIIWSESKRDPKEELMDFALPPAKKIMETQLSDLEKRKLQVKGKELIYDIISKRGLIDLEDLFEMDKFIANLENLLYILECKGSIDDLYYKVGSGVMETEDLEKNLDAFGITKQNLGISSILIEGLDGPQISTLVTSKVGELGGNIGPMNNRPHETPKGTTFTLRMVVENLSLENEKNLIIKLQEDPRITKIIVV